MDIGRLKCPEWKGVRESDTVVIVGLLTVGYPVGGRMTAREQSHNERNGNGETKAT